jgi:hypothetical protein
MVRGRDDTPSDVPDVLAANLDVVLRSILVTS